MILKKKQSRMKLDEVSELLNQIATPLSLYLLPVNLEEEKIKFFDSSVYNPQFKYRKPKAVSKNNSVLSRLEVVEEITDVDPQISDYIIKTIAAKRQASDLLSAIGHDEKFIRISNDRFGNPSYRLFRKACSILRGNYSKFNLVSRNKKLRERILYYDDLVDVFNVVFDKFGLEGWSLDKSKAIMSSGFRTAMKTKRVMVDPDVKVSAEKLRKTIIHEVGTHALRGNNGFNSGFAVFGKPNLPEYLDDEEGLAFYNEERFGVLRDIDLRKRAAQVYSVYLANSMSFREVYNALRSVYPKNTDFNTVLRVKRGLSDTSRSGAYSKDVSYLRGFINVRKKLDNDKVSYRNMYAGKIPTEYLFMVEEGIISKPKVVPSKELIDDIFEEAGLN